MCVYIYAHRHILLEGVWLLWGNSPVKIKHICIFLIYYLISPYLLPHQRHFPDNQYITFNSPKTRTFWKMNTQAWQMLAWLDTEHKTHITDKEHGDVWQLPIFNISIFTFTCLQPIFNSKSSSRETVSYYY